MGLFASAGFNPLRPLACRIAGVHLLSDVHERGCDLGISPPLGRKRLARITSIERSGLLFVHIPKAAGMSISDALYGDQVKHVSIRLLRHLDGGRLAGLQSFAVVRDPVYRFLSAYRYARAGGSAHNDVAEPFRSLYLRFRSIDDALDHIAGAADPYQVDHIFRPQHWYVTDRLGRIAVDRLFRMRDIPHLPLLLPNFPDRPIPNLNRSRGSRHILSAGQLKRLQSLYPADFALRREISVGMIRNKASANVMQPAMRAATAVA